ncbi:rRNA maturation RNase YbeY [Sulfitobacter sp. S190]|uniref:rRNA maturation RNase YbeY n=1 Tax=Sulfitobacter sp. S190 TaxID=2867022 RepID=UPI0021A31795|nr:rRNA maturation RNase YbeY [Sulfitobacter sp. S190]UWR23259.1 rRNA maturation RNase YbeY [Sulfitobacter sp. S190]
METLDILIEEGAWDAGMLTEVATRAVVATLQRQNVAPDLAEIAVLACDDAQIAQLNAEFRGKPTPTNVLSWPAQELGPDTEGAPPAAPQAGFDGMIELGDIAVSLSTCAREAEDSGKTLSDHLTHLIVHGTLHLLGFDHIRDGDAVLMEHLEIEILGKMGLDDPYMSATLIVPPSDARPTKDRT